MRQLKAYVLIISALAMIIATVVAMTVVGVEHFKTKSAWESNRERLVNDFVEEVDNKVMTALRLFFSLGQQAHEDLYSRATREITLLEHLFYERYKTVKLSEHDLSQVEVMNQFTESYEKIKTPILSVGEDSVETRIFKEGIIQEWAQGMDAKGSIMQRINKAGDMLRIDSNFACDGVLAQNWYLPSTIQADATNSIIKNLLENKSVWSPVRFIQHILFAYYKPIVDDNKKCIGAFEVVFQEDDVLKNLCRLAFKSLEQEGVNVAVLHTKNNFFLGTNLLECKGIKEDKLMLISNISAWRLLIEEILSETSDNTKNALKTTFFKCVKKQFEDPTTSKIYNVRAAYLPSFDWLIMLAFDHANSHSKMDLLELNINRWQFPFTKTLIYTFLAISFIGFVFFKLVDKRLDFVQNHLTRLREVLTKIRAQQLNFEFYDGLNDDQHVLADLLKQGREMAACVKNYISEENNISKDIHHKLDNLVTNFELTQKLNAQLTRGHISIAAGFETVYNKMKKAEDGAALLAKAVTENKALHACLNQKMQSMEVLCRQERQHIDKTMSEVTETMSTLDSLQQAIQSITNTKCQLLQLAEQTNLLSLNATIEASISSVEGKGFAIVAEQVKDLSKETAKSTNAIDKEVENIKKATSLVVEKIHNIRILTEKSETTFSQWQVASSIENTEIHAWISQVEQWTSTLNPLVQTIQEFANIVGTLYKDLEQMNSAFERNRQYVSAFQNDIEGLQRNFDELRRLLLSWELE